MMSSHPLESTPVERQAVQPAVSDNDGPPLARVLDIRQRFACVLPGTSLVGVDEGPLGPLSLIPDSQFSKTS